MKRTFSPWKKIQLNFVPNKKFKKVDPVTLCFVMRKQFLRDRLLAINIVNWPRDNDFLPEKARKKADTSRRSHRLIRGFLAPVVDKARACSWWRLYPEKWCGGDQWPTWTGTKHIRPRIRVKSEKTMRKPKIIHWTILYWRIR